MRSALVHQNSAEVRRGGGDIALAAQLGAHAQRLRARRLDLRRRALYRSAHPLFVRRRGGIRRGTRRAAHERLLCLCDEGLFVHDCFEAARECALALLERARHHGMLKRNEARIRRLDARDDAARLQCEISPHSFLACGGVLAETTSGLAPMHCGAQLVDGDEKALLDGNGSDD